MRKNQLLYALIAAGLGFLSLIVCYPVAQPLYFGYKLDRASAVESGQRYASKFGVDVSHWHSTIETQDNGWLHYWLSRNSNDAVAALANPYTIKITFTPESISRLVVQQAKSKRELDVLEPAAGSTPKVVVFLFPNGRLFQFKDETAAHPSFATGTERELAEMAFREIAGQEASSFTPGKQAVTDKTNTKYEWVLTKADVTFRVAVDFEGTTLRQASLWRERNAAYLAESDSRLQVLEWFKENASRPGFIAPLVVLAFIIATLRKRIDYRFAIGFGLYAAAALTTRDDQPYLRFEPSVIYISFFAVLGVTAYSCMGQLSAGRHDTDAWIDFVTFFRGQVFTKRSGRALLFGILFAPLVAFLPAALAYMSPFAVMGRHYPILSPQPLLQRLIPSLTIPQAIALLFLIPLAGRFIKRPWLRYLLQVPAASVIFLFNTRFVVGTETAVAVALLTALLANFLYHKYGMLTLTAAFSFSSIAAGAALMGASQAVSLQSTSLQLWGYCAVILAGSIVLSLRGPDLPLPADITAGFDADAKLFLTEREKLMGELSQAHEVQQRMLPSSPPVVPGFSLSAACKPARDVGGDLFDYFSMADGRLGLCVADVSGKGMGAALYMTLTKGVLVSAARESATLLDLVKNLNTHLYAACRRKMFVTAVFGALDRKTRTVEMIRAGHNPALLLQAATGKTQFLKPPGLGLGLSATRNMGLGLRLLTFVMEPGDALVLYSDGITEAMNHQLDEYGEARLEAIVSGSTGLSAIALCQKIQIDVAAFANGSLPHDDATLLVLVCDSQNSE